MGLKILISILILTLLLTLSKSVLKNPYYFILNQRILLKEGEVGQKCDPNVSFDCLSIPSSYCSREQGKCTCSPNFYHNVQGSGRCEKLPEKIDDVCTIPIREGDLCSNKIPGSYCQIFPPNIKGLCKCDSNHLNDPENLKFCRIGISCRANEDCPVKNTYCYDGQPGIYRNSGKINVCKCLPGYEELIYQGCVKIREPDDGDSSSSKPTMPKDRDRTTTKSPILKPGELIQVDGCRQRDSYGALWEGNRGTKVVQACHQGKSGTASWFCNSNGKFNGTNPDFSDCKTAWITKTFNKLDDLLNHNMSDVSIGDVNDLLGDVTLYLESARDNLKDSYFGHELGKIMNLLENIAGNLTCGQIELNDLERAFEKSIQSCGNILKYNQPWEQLPEQEKAENFYHLMGLFESNSYNLLISRLPESHLAQNSKYNQSYNANNSFSFIAGAEFIVPKTLLLTEENDLSTLSLDPDLFIAIQGSEDSSLILLPNNWKEFYPSQDNPIPGGCINNKGAKFAGIEIESELVRDKFGNNMIDNDENLHEDKLMNSKLLSFSFLIGPEPRNMISSDKKMRSVDLNGGKIKLRFKHDKLASKTPIPKSEFKTEGRQCVFWDADKLLWSTQGCQVVESESDEQFTTCECSHLTAFSVLMGKHVKDDVLNIFTIVLCSLSVICLISTIVLLTRTPQLNKLGQTTIIKNICFTLTVGHFLIIFQNPIIVESIPGGLCFTIGVLMHYAFLSAFMWMGLMGWHIFRIIVFVFSDMGKSFKSTYTLLGYVIPLVFVGIIASIGREDAYSWESESYCWLRGDYKWTFMIPVAVIVIANMVIYCIAYKITVNLKNFKTIRATRAKSQKPNLVGFLCLSITLGLTWIPGYLQIIDNSSVSAYIFTILNASQGIFIFVFQYMQKEKIVKDSKKRLTTNSNSRISDSNCTYGGHKPALHRQKTLSKQISDDSIKKSEPEENHDTNNNQNKNVDQENELKSSEFETNFRIYTIERAINNGEFPITADMNYLLPLSSDDSSEDGDKNDPNQKKETKILGWKLKY